jgi:hypothetical protein
MAAHVIGRRGVLLKFRVTEQQLFDVLGAACKRLPIVILFCLN